MKLEHIFELSLATYKSVADKATKQVIPAITGADNRGSSIRRGAKHSTAASIAKKKIAKLTHEEDEEDDELVDEQPEVK